MSSDSNKYAKRRARSFHISTIMSITLVLFMLGLLGLVILHARKISDMVKENIELSLFIDEKAAEADVSIFQKQLDVSRYVKSTEFITKDEAAQRLKQDLGEDFVTFLGYNPLQPSIDVRLKAAYANPDSLLWIEKKFRENPVVQDVYYQKSLVDMVNENLRTIALVILGFSSMLALISVALINNTIRLSLYSRRFIIKSMQLVGATKGFIRKPFLVSGVLNGLYSGILACAMLAGIISFVQKQVPELVIIQRDIELFALLFLSIVLLGIVLSFSSTYLAVSKYLRVKMDDLYN